LVGDPGGSSEAKVVPNVSAVNVKVAVKMVLLIGFHVAVGVAIECR